MQGCPTLHGTWLISTIHIKQIPLGNGYLFPQFQNHENEKTIEIVYTNKIVIYFYEIIIVVITGDWGQTRIQMKRTNLINVNLLLDKKLMF